MPIFPSLRPETEPKPEGPWDHVTQVARQRTVELHGVETLDEVNAYEHTAYAFSRKRKWWILTVVALCQTSMNFVSPVEILFCALRFFGFYGLERV